MIIIQFQLIIIQFITTLLSLPVDSRDARTHSKYVYEDLPMMWISPKNSTLIFDFLLSE